MRKITLDIWRLVAALLLVALHASLLGQTKQYAFHGAYVYTEFFFMISGFFMTEALEKKKFHEPLDYPIKTWKKIFPYTTIVIVLHYLFIGMLAGSTKELLKTIIKIPMEVLYLPELHILTAELGQLWYLSAMLIVMPLVCWIFIRDEKLFKSIMFLLPLLWLGYSFTTWGHLGHRGCFIDLIRAFTILLLGGGAYYVVLELNKKCLRGYWVTIIGHMSFLFTIILTYKYYLSQWDFYCILFLFIALVASQVNTFKDVKYLFLESCSELSLCIYIVHVPAGRYIQRFFSDSNIFTKYILYFGLTVLFASILFLIMRFLKKRDVRFID